MLAEPETEEPAEKHRPNVRQMQDSTRAREKNRKRRRRSSESTYLKESVTGEFQRPDARTVPEEPPASRRHWEEEKDYYYQEKQTGSFRPIRQRVRSHTFGEDADKRKPDDLGLVKKTLENLRNVVFFRFVAMLVLTLAGAVLACLEVLSGSAFLQTVTPRGYSIIQLALGLLGLGVMFPTVKNGLWNLLRFHADSDSMAVLPLLPTLLGAVCAVVAPETLSSGTVHLYVPCALLALFCNIIGRLLMVRRALRNVNVISREGQKRVLSLCLPGGDRRTAHPWRAARYPHCHRCAQGRRGVRYPAVFLFHGYGGQSLPHHDAHLRRSDAAHRCGHDFDSHGNGVRDALDQLFLLHAGTIAGGVLRYGERPGSQSAAGA